MNRIIIAGFLRSLARQRLYAAINIGGLAVGIAVCLVVGLYVRFEKSFDTWLPNYREIYVLEESTDLSRLGLRVGPPMALVDAVYREMPGLAAARAVDLPATVIFDGIGHRESMLLVDRNLFDVVALPVERGDTRSTLAGPSGLLITHRLARKYFGQSDPLGKGLSLSIEGEKATYRVGAVLKDPPANSDPGLQFDLMTRLKVPTERGAPNYEAFHNWSYQGPPPYFRITTPENASRLESLLERLLRRQDGKGQAIRGGHGRLRLRPLSSLHFLRPGSTLTVVTLGLTGLLTLLIAVVNYINLSTARSALRAPEVAMCQVLGADRPTLFRQFLGEALLTCAIAAFLGLSVAEIALPFVNTLGKLDLQLQYLGSNGVVLPLVLLTLAVAACAGSYPAWALSRWPASELLAAPRPGAAGRAGARVREGLVIFQFALATACIISTAVLIAQTRYAGSHDVGFTPDGLLIVSSLASKDLSSSERARLLHRFNILPEVSGVAQSNTAPGGSGVITSTYVAIPGVPGEGPAFQFFVGTRSFLPAVGARLLAGRLFEASDRGEADAEATAESPSVDVVINRSGARALRFASPEAAIGKTVGGRSPKTIIGVIEDMRFVSPREIIQPTLYEHQERNLFRAVGLVRFSGDAVSIVDTVRRVWREEAPEVPFSAATAADRLRGLRETDDRAARLFSMGAALAMAIACVGLWGLASFNTARRAREIGIRRSLGASSGDILRLLVGQFIRPVLMSNLLAWPLAYFAMRTWLAGFDDRIALSPLFFVFGTAAALTIAIATVSGQSLRAARAAPAWSLRHD